jgi:2,4-dienoyl-CoA reductase-like NADH-dependent reductase (Old Yellow Enzyme family)
LLSTFYSASTNKRTDEYGGSFENRIRFILEVTEAVRAVWPKTKPFWVRLSCSDYTNPEIMGESPEGWDIHQTIRLAKELKKLGVDTIDCSSGGIVNGVKYPAAPMYQVQFAEAIRKEADIATAAVGLIIDGEDAEDILQKERADFILVGREYLRNSAWALGAAQSLDVEISWPQQYSWAVKKARRRNTQKVQENGGSKIAEPLQTLP